jgi:hypothetical protein
MIRLDSALFPMENTLAYYSKEKKYRPVKFKRLATEKIFLWVETRKEISLNYQRQRTLLNKIFVIIFEKSGKN